MIKDFHLKPLASLSYFVANLSHPYNSQSGSCDFKSHQAVWYVGGPRIHSNLVTYSVDQINENRIWLLADWNGTGFKSSLFEESQATILPSKIFRADERSNAIAMSAVAALTTPGVLATFTPRLAMKGRFRWSTPTPPLAITFKLGRV